MSYSGAVLCVLLAALGAAAICLAVHRFVPVGRREEHHDVGSTVFLQMGVLFAVLLAFVFSGAYSEYGEAQRAIDLECGALHATAMLASTLPAPEASDLLGLEKRYLDDVVRREWPDLRERKVDREIAAPTLTELVRYAARLPAATLPDTTVKAQILSLLAEAHAQREMRLFQATNGLPGVLWVVLIGMAQLLVLFVALAGVKHVAPLLAFAVIFAVATASTLVLVRLLDYPFEGAIGLDSRSFAETARKIAELD